MKISCKYWPFLIGLTVTTYSYSQFLGGSGRGFSKGSLTAGALPISLLYFTAESMEEQVSLKWQTATEINNDYFSVEKSLDAVQWKTIATVKGAGNSSISLSYEAFDPDPVNGIQYYRIKQTDFDGSYTYSNIVSIVYGSVVKQDITLFPNPSENFVSVFFPGNTQRLASIRLFSTQGQLLEQWIYPNGNGFVIDVSAYTKDFYLVQVLESGKYYSAKLKKE